MKESLLNRGRLAEGIWLTRSWIDERILGWVASSFIMTKLIKKTDLSDPHINLDETVLCSNGSWIDGSSAVLKYYKLDSWPVFRRIHIKPTL